ncbi:MAG: HAD-IA family hydrolase [Proteobacteria bacterium]|nr:HAD-IA family hydrolase [Pseudomonadota bacterium]
MIKAVLWDFGGVITSSPFEAFNRYEEENDIPKDFIRTINATNPTTNAWAQFESSRLTVDQFDGKFEEESRAAGKAIPGGEVLKLLAGAVRPRMVEALKKCKEHFTIGCITNNMKTDEGSAIPQSSDQAVLSLQAMQLFDEVIESSKEGVRKPDPEIYSIALERLGVKADECVFLDDLGINLKPAKAMGMKTIKVLNVDQALGELEEHTGLSFH